MEKRNHKIRFGLGLSEGGEARRWRWGDEMVVKGGEERGRREVTFPLTQNSPYTT